MYRPRLELEELNQSIRQRDKMKDDAIVVIRSTYGFDDKNVGDREKTTGIVMQTLNAIE
jgi:hypothetical protein